MNSALVECYRAVQDAIIPERRLVRHFIARHLPRLAPAAGGLSIDVGGGTAPYARALKAAWPKAGHIVSDCLPSEHVGLLADVERLPIGCGRVDLVTLFQVLQHIPDPQAALAECRRILRPQGLILITYPFLVGEGRSRDQWRWTSTGMEQNLAMRGFDVVAHETHGGPALMVTALLAALPGRLLIRHRHPWRTGRSTGDAAILGLALLLALPFHLLGLLAMRLDRLVRSPTHHIGGTVLARRRADG